MTTRAYSTFTIDTDRDAALVEGIEWAFAQAEGGPEPVLWMPDAEELAYLPVTKGMVRAGLELFADRPGRRGHSRIPQGAPVVAFCQPIDRLVELEPAQYPVALVGAFYAGLDPRFPSWGEGTYHRPWIDAFDPALLSGEPIPVRELLIEAPALRVAMKDFTSTTFGGTTMYDSRDRDRVVSGLMQLRQAGITIDADGLFSDALGRGWRGSQAVRLRDVAQEIARGVAKRPRHSYRPGIVDEWLAAANVEESF